MMSRGGLTSTSACVIEQSSWPAAPQGEVMEPAGETAMTWLAFAHAPFSRHVLLNGHSALTSQPRQLLSLPQNGRTSSPSQCLSSMHSTHFPSRQTHVPSHAPPSRFLLDLLTGKMSQAARSKVRAMRMRMRSSTEIREDSDTRVWKAM